MVDMFNVKLVITSDRCITQDATLLNLLINGRLYLNLYRLLKRRNACMSSTIAVIRIINGINVNSVTLITLRSVNDKILKISGRANDCKDNLTRTYVKCSNLIRL